jgi:hypothetical protein
MGMDTARLRPKSYVVGLKELVELANEGLGWSLCRLGKLSRGCGWANKSCKVMGEMPYLMYVPRRQSLVSADKLCL